MFNKYYQDELAFLREMGKEFSQAHRALVPRGTEVHSVPVEGTRCRFRTCYDVNLYPVVLEAASLEESAGSPLRLRLSFLMTGGVQLRQVEMRALRIFLHGPPEVTSLVYLLLRQSVSEIAFQGYLEGRASQRMNLPLASLQPVGFAADEALLPYPENSFTGFR